MGFSMKSKKEDIFEALKEAHEQLDKAGLLEESQGDSSTRDNEAKALAEADKAVEEKLLSPELLGKYEAVKTATELKQKELNKLYKIEESMQSLLVTARAKVQTLTKWDAEEESAKQEHEIKIERYAKNCVEKIRGIDAEEAEHIKEIEYKRKTAEAEYQYSTMRLHKAVEDEWQDKKAELEKEQKAKTDALIEREEAINKREEEIKALEEKVKSIPELLENERTKAFADGKADAGKSYGFEKRALESEYNHQIKMLEAKLENTETTNSEIKAINITINEKLDRAYGEMRELASKVAENGGVKMISSGDNNKK